MDNVPAHLLTVFSEAIETRLSIGGGGGDQVVVRVLVAPHILGCYALINSSKLSFESTWNTSGVGNASDSQRTSCCKDSAFTEEPTGTVSSRLEDNSSGSCGSCKTGGVAGLAAKFLVLYQWVWYNGIIASHDLLHHLRQVP